MYYLNAAVQPDMGNETLGLTHPFYHDLRRMILSLNQTLTLPLDVDVSRNEFIVTSGVEELQSRHITARLVLNPTSGQEMISTVGLGTGVSR